MQRPRQFRMKVVFPYFAQFHQVLHSLPIAAEMANLYPDVEVHVAGARQEHLDFVRRLLARHAPGAPLHLDLLKPVILRRFPHKKRLMFKNRRYFRSFEAIVAPERTSLFMRKFGLGQTQLIWTRHGAGDRAMGFAADVHQFDYVLMAGRKIEQRLLDAGQIRPGLYTTGVYAKFDWLMKDGPRPRLFDNDRPTVLYNPHFDETLGSWSRFGKQLLECFAGSTRYNLIFAPHVRLFDPPTAKAYAAFEGYRRLPHLHIDLGSESSIDMSYVNAADLYLGDVSSQVAEFLCRPRPCMFLNAHRVNWRDNPNYRAWSLGMVIDELNDFGQQLDGAFAGHGRYLERQQRYLAETFDLMPGQSSAARGATAIVEHLRKIWNTEASACLATESGESQGSGPTRSFARLPTTSMAKSSMSAPGATRTNAAATTGSTSGTPPATR